MKMKRLSFLLLATVIMLAGCGNSKLNDEEKDTSVKELNVQADQTDIIDKDIESNSTCSWDKTLIINGENYKVGDPISTLHNIKWNWPTDIIQYVASEPNGNNYLQLGIGTFSCAQNISKRACKPEECVITSLMIPHSQVKEVMPDIPDMKNLDDYFGEQNKVETMDYGESVGVRYMIDNCKIYVSGPKDGEVEDLSVDYGLYSKESDSYLDSIDEYITEINEFDSFNMGFSNYTFLDKEKISNLKGGYVSETDYMTYVSFDYEMDGYIFNVCLREAYLHDYTEYGDRRGNRYGARDMREVTAGNNTYTIWTSSACSYNADETIICKYKSDIELETYTEGMTDELFTELLEELENVISVSEL